MRWPSTPGCGWLVTSPSFQAWPRASSSRSRIAPQIVHFSLTEPLVSQPGSTFPPSTSANTWSCSSGTKCAVTTTPPASALLGTVKVRLALPPAEPIEADQWSNRHPLAAVAVTVEQVPPFLTIWLRAPLIEPLPSTTNSTGTFAPRTAIGSEEISPSGTPAGSGIVPSGCGRRSSVSRAWVRTYWK